MEQYIPKSALVAEIERRILEDYNSDDIEMDEVAQGVLASLKYFIDTLEVKEVQEEPVSEDLEEAINAYIGYAPEVDECSSVYGKRQAFKAGAEWQKAKDESTTEDLGEYINELSKQFPEVSFAKLSRIAVRVAKWQKEQIMKNAVETIIHSKPNDYGEFIPIIHVKVGSSYKDGEKVKVIIIKEDICG